VADFFNNARRWGIVKTTYGTVMRRLRPWLMLSEIRLQPAGEVSTPEDGKTRIASRDDLLRASFELPEHFDPEFVQDALERGDVCVAAFDEQKITAFAWRSFSTAPHQDGLWVSFPRGYCYCYKLFTLPEYRGKHILDSEVTENLAAQRGCTHLMTFAETHNYPSITRSNRIGATVVGYAGYFLLFGRPYPFRSLGARKHQFRFYRKPASNI
jgi:GNAT superfamily N-acetyltransferase